MKRKGIKVFVGMSGGVDSSVSAALLKKAGYDVTGVFIKVWQDPELVECDWKEDRRDAMRVGALLDIPFLTFNFEKEYKKEVVDYMIREYKAGRTPNPDVMCNQQIKFGSFYKKARAMGADFIATGHYAISKNGELLESKDKNKDQSYFLWGIKPEVLKHTLFPIGHLTKPEVRQLAKKFKLPNAEKKDSQGLCFIGKVDMKEFLSHFIKSKQGKVLNESGEVIGHHPGAVFFTIGERHGFIITKKSPDDKPFYVVKKDVKRNVLVVSSKLHASKPFSPQPNTRFATDLSRGRLASGPPVEKELATAALCRIKNTNWINGEPSPKKTYSCRIRYRQEKQKCRIEKNKVTFSTPQHSLAPGQSLVLYDGEKCLGGGVIS